MVIFIARDHHYQSKYSSAKSYHSLILIKLCLNLLLDMWEKEMNVEYLDQKLLNLMEKNVYYLNCVNDTPKIS